MKYMSIDLETSSLKRNEKNVLTLSMVYVDSKEPDTSKWPFIHLLFLHDFYNGDDYALKLNEKILDQRKSLNLDGTVEEQNATISAYTHVVENWYQATDIIAQFFVDVSIEKRAIAAGKNVAGFDLQFFPYDVKNLFIHRTMDPGSMYATHEDDVPPDTAECCRRAGISDTVAHTAYDDAIQVAILINNKLGVK